PRNRLEQARLSTAVGAHDPKPLPGLDLEAQVAQHLGCAVQHGQAVDPEQRHVTESLRLPPERPSKLVRIPGINTERIRFAKSTCIFTAMKNCGIDDRSACPDQCLRPRCRGT